MQTHHRRSAIGPRRASLVLILTSIFAISLAAFLPQTSPPFNLLLPMVLLRLEPASSVPPLTPAAPTVSPTATATTAAATSAVYTAIPSISTPTATTTSTATPTASLTPSPSPTPTSTPTKTPVPNYGIQVGEFVEIRLTGPFSMGMGQPNPFKINLDVTFTGPGGQRYLVPGFYDGDGAGGLNGNVWKARFAPGQGGEWQFTSSSPDSRLNGVTGSFYYSVPTGCAAYSPGGLPDFNCTGQLLYAGGHYLQFANGENWLKGGEDDPEDFLAPGVNAGFSSKASAVDFLSSKGVNSLYMLLNNIGGDNVNVWPWVGATEAEAQANHERYDLARLASWEALFTHIQDRGLVLNLVFEDDSGWRGFNRSLYYRQMVARFGHHKGLIWNLTEEYNEAYSADEVKGFAGLLRGLDPYDHPLTVHHHLSTDTWLPFVGDDRFDLTSFQTYPPASPLNDLAVTWYYRVENSGRTIAVSFDETGWIAPGDRDNTRHIVWSVYMGGAMIELHTYPLNSYQDYAETFDDMHRARAFLERLPYGSMRPRNDLIQSGSGYVFARSGVVYAVYLPSGGQLQLDLSTNTNTYQVSWYNPRTGENIPGGASTGGGTRTFNPPAAGDWALLLEAD